MKFTPEQALLAMEIGDATHDARRLILAGYFNRDEESLSAGIQKAAAVIGKQAAISGVLNAY